MPQPKSARWWLCCAALASFSLQQAFADPGGGCPVPSPAPSFSAIPEDGPGPPTTQVRADQIESQDQETVLLSGDAEVQRGDQRILADQIVYDQVENHLEATGNVRLENVQGDQFRTEQLFLELDQFIGYTSQGSYSLASNNARGDAQYIELSGKERVNLSKVRYTTCPPGRDDWFLKLGRLSLDKSRNLGVARNAVVRFKRVPIFYWPYLRFPISDQRQTGFLAPELGKSTKNGVEFGWPFYWNIAPNYDATITPRILSERGFQAQTEFRYLGRPLQGQLDAEFLPDDDQTRPKLCR